MSWKDDAHGIVVKASEVKLYFGRLTQRDDRLELQEHTWKMKLSQLDRQQGKVRILTYSLPSPDYAVELLSKRPRNVFIICNRQFEFQAQVIKTLLPDVRLATIERLHSKILLIEPSTVYVTSANFGHSGWHETWAGIRSQAAHDAYVRESFSPLWEVAREVYAV